ncbi:hypothetical protein R1sor_013171 [Riccia sorocarpa]|uniref:ADP-ribosylation factor n=1 Tax=Riccia sorocarpa TaxID=122646 RepID=A0ABD3H8P3_9MARC
MTKAVDWNDPNSYLKRISSFGLTGLDNQNSQPFSGSQAHRQRNIPRERIKQHISRKQARDELHGLINDPELAHVTLLVLANKMDLLQAMNVAEITDKLQLTSLRQTTWYIQSCCATSGQGLYEGLDWLGGALQDVASRH